MSERGRPLHLIERAAQRLGQSIASTPAMPLLSQIEPDHAARPPEPELSPRHVSNGTGLSIDEVALRSAGMIDWNGADSRAADEFRIVQSEILRQIAGGGRGPGTAPRANLVMITSALPGEGKSFTTLNLAIGIARQGDHRVLLVDVDGRPGSLSDLFGLSEAPGLLELAANQAGSPDEVIVRTSIDGLDILPCGAASQGSIAEIFAGKRMAAVLDSLARRYASHLILLDAPPCLASSQPHVLAPSVGQTVLVIAADSTQQGQIEAALELVRASPSVSLLLNKVRTWNKDSFGAYAYPA